MSGMDAFDRARMEAERAIAEGREPILDGIRNRALRESAFRDGMLAGARIARMQKSDTWPQCPPGMVAVYIEAAARGEEI